MKTFTKNIFTRTMALTMLMAASGSVFAANTAVITASTSIQAKTVLYAASSLTIPEIDPLAAAGSQGDGGTTNNFCVYSNASTANKYTIAVNANSNLTGPGGTLAYAVSFTQGSTSLSYTVDSTTAPAADTTKQFNSTRNKSACTAGVYDDAVAGGRINISVPESAWSNAVAGSYSGNLSITVTSA